MYVLRSEPQVAQVHPIVPVGGLGRRGDGQRHHTAGCLSGLGPAAHEHQARHTGGRGGQHRDLTHGVPGADVDQQHGDDVVAAGLLGRVHVGRAVGAAQGDGGFLPAGQGVPRHGGREQAGGSADRQVPDPASPERGRRELGREAAQYQDEDHQADGFDEELGERDVGCALQVEQGGHTVTADTDEDDRVQATPHEQDQQTGDDDDQRGDDLHRGVPQAQSRVVAGPDSTRDHGDARADHEEHQDGSEVDRERTALGATGDLQGQALQPRRHPPVVALGVKDREAVTEPGHPVAEVEQHQTTGDTDRR